jgi:hypothetical protein
MFATIGSALALNTDLRDGVYDRFRSPPIARSAPLVGHILGDSVKYGLSVVLVFAFGAVLGFRFGGGVLAVAGAAGLLMSFALVTCWIGVVARTRGDRVGAQPCPDLPAHLREQRLRPDREAARLAAGVGEDLY